MIVSLSLPFEPYGTSFSAGVIPNVAPVYTASLMWRGKRIAAQWVRGEGFRFFRMVNIWRKQQQPIPRKARRWVQLTRFVEP
jgi:hypothetical protein